ncbi:MAG: ribosomal protein S18-alanine N-acetyltransferase [Chloroflexi bacterium]|nr:ribosomal protein S18-alanine N-acetyltransferase [Chloroflexota bacterium]
MEFSVQPMRVEHIPAVCAIERLSFTQTWPPNAYRKELSQNKLAYYVVVRRDDAPALTPADLGLSSGQPAPRNGSVVGRISRLFKRPEPEPRVPVDELARVVGYAGLWLMVDEAHITTIAVHPKYRGYGIGELLLLKLVDIAHEIGARWLTLEVRASNKVAQALYAKYSFREMGVRQRYYSDDSEDALVMWTDPIDTPAFKLTVERLRAQHTERLAQRGR